MNTKLADEKLTLCHVFSETRDGNTKQPMETNRAREVCPARYAGFQRRLDGGNEQSGEEEKAKPPKPKGAPSAEEWPASGAALRNGNGRTPGRTVPGLDLDAAAAESKSLSVPLAVAFMLDELSAQHEGLLVMTCPRTVEKMRGFLREAYQDFVLHAPKVDRLPSIIRLNLIDALARNAIHIGFDPRNICSEELISPLNMLGPMAPGSSSSTAVALRWLDDCDVSDVTSSNDSNHDDSDGGGSEVGSRASVASRHFRDNLVREVDAGRLDDDELCLDIIQFAGGADGRAPPSSSGASRQTGATGSSRGIS
ncbi:unnamed protein product [Parascedosporium putredinis]|uniref:Uncharacterized protein n=1 Tax=Parascedosporium putredinis TaxID=1442378 RepID=A0A9P1MF20_9PEZI|nr:unnamed protein product [Parascedosporium putredinis]CAI8004075.1 unnamed protein product [Parascedosporium putredinis]